MSVWFSPKVVALLGGVAFASGQLVAQSDVETPAEEPPVTARSPNWDYSFDDPQYEDVMADVLSLGLASEESGEGARCVHNPKSLSVPPCPESLALYEDFIERHGLEDNRFAGRLFEAYADGDHRTGDRLYARLKGYKLPRYRGPGEDVVALGIAQKGGRDQDCENNYFAPNPCPAAVRAYREFVRKHNLPTDHRSARAFEAYVEGDYRTGDVFYAFAAGLPGPPQYAGPGAEIAELASGYHREIYRQTKGDTKCGFSYHHPAPCPGVVGQVKKFAKEQGLPLDYRTAKIFENYADPKNPQFEQGDRLLAEAKGMTVAELYESQGLTPPPDDEQPKRLIVRIRPSKS